MSITLCKELKEQHNEINTIFEYIDEVLQECKNTSSLESSQKLCEVITDLKKAVEIMNNRLYWIEVNLDQINNTEDW